MPVRTEVLMGTLVTIQVVHARRRTLAIERAFGWFREIEERCTRFDERQRADAALGAHRCRRCRSSAILFEAVQFRDVGGRGQRRRVRSDRRPTDGGARLQPRASHRAERPLRSPGRAASAIATSTWILNDRTITLDRPLTLDLGAVAKGLAIDMAARELQPFEDFAIDAGGDLYLGGCNPDGAPWSIGHPSSAPRRRS